MMGVVSLAIGVPMSSTAQSLDRITEQEYLDGEKLNDIKREYTDGYVYVMAGVSKRHNTISLNIMMSLRDASRKTPCAVYCSDVKVRVAETKSYYYPDVVVGCDVDDTDDYYLEKPCLVVEVLSESTQKRDRPEKLLSYMNVPTLKAYLLVEQDKPEVELFYRKKAGDWWVESFEGLDAVLKLACPEMELTLAEIYEGISL